MEQKMTRTNERISQTYKTSLKEDPQRKDPKHLDACIYAFQRLRCKMFESELESIENTIDLILKGEIYSDSLQDESTYKHIKKQINDFDVKVKLKANFDSIFSPTNCLSVPLFSSPWGIVNNKIAGYADVFLGSVDKCKYLLTNKKSDYYSDIFVDPFKFFKDFYSAKIIRLTHFPYVQRNYKYYYDIEDFRGCYYSSQDKLLKKLSTIITTPFLAEIKIKPVPSLRDRRNRITPINESAEQILQQIRTYQEFVNNVFVNSKLLVITDYQDSQLKYLTENDDDINFYILSERFDYWRETQKKLNSNSAEEF
jgi:hypothetical protein